MTSAYGQITLSKVEDGASITVTSTSYEYKLSTSGTTPPTGTWEKNPVAPTNTQFAWTKTTVTFSDGSKSITYTVGGKTGTNGTNGTNGTSVTVSKTEYAYQKSTSGTTVPTGTWLPDPVEPTQTEYVWTRTIVTFSNGSKATTYTVGGKTGQTGPQGKGISSIVTQYYLSTSNTSQSGGSWNTTPAAYVNGRYYWRRDHITWSDSTTSDTTAVLDNALTTANKNAYDAQYAVDNMEIGGRNLLRFTGTCEHFLPLSSNVYVMNDEDIPYIRIATSSVGWTSTAPAPYIPFEAIQGKTVTVSCEVRLVTPIADTASALYLTMHAYKYQDGTTSRTGHKDYSFNSKVLTAGEWVKLSYTRYIDKADWSVDTSIDEMLYVSVAAYNHIAGTIDIRHMKLEIGNVATDWSPAPEDLVEQARLQTPITAAAAMTEGKIICGTDSGYRDVAAGVSFDLGHSLLYCGKTIASGASSVYNYLSYDVVNASITGTIESGAAKKTLYLKGSISNNSFVISASPFLTTVIPDAESEYYYIPLGVMYSTTNIYFNSTNRLYTYINGAFQAVDAAGQILALQSINRLNTMEPLVESHSAQLNVMQDSIMSNVEANYTRADEFNTYVDSQQSSLEQLSNSITAQFSESRELISSVNGALETYKDDISKYIRFSADGIEIGEEGNALTLKIDNDEIGFYKEGDQIAYWDGSTLYTGNAWITLERQFRIGNFAAIPRSDGSVSWLKVGE